MDCPELNELNRVAKYTVGTFHFVARTYHALQTLQRYAVPVYLGDIYLPQNIYYLPTRAIVHMCLIVPGRKGIEGRPSNGVVRGVHVSHTNYGGVHQKC
jgi:hypothetical protein